MVPHAAHSLMVPQLLNLIWPQYPWQMKHISAHIPRGEIKVTASFHHAIPNPAPSFSTKENVRMKDSNTTIHITLNKLFIFKKASYTLDLHD